MSLEVWKITKRGSDFAGGVTPKSRDTILDYLRKNKTATLDQLSTDTGISPWRLRTKLAEYCKKGLVIEVTEGMAT